MLGGGELRGFPIFKKQLLSRAGGSMGRIPPNFGKCKKSFNGIAMKLIKQDFDDVLGYLEEQLTAQNNIIKRSEESIRQATVIQADYEQRIAEIKEIIASL